MRIPPYEKSLMSKKDELYERSIVWCPKHMDDKRALSTHYGSMAKIWWKCVACDYEWTALSGDVFRKNRPSGCKKCKYVSNGKQRATPATVEASVFGAVGELADRNILPDMTDAEALATKRGSGKKKWWICTHSECNGYRWLQTPCTVVNGGHGCIMCKNRATGVRSSAPKSMAFSLYGYKDALSSRDIEYCISDAEAAEVACSSDKKQSFVCAVCRTKWTATPKNVLGRNETGCPSCSNGTGSVCESVLRNAIKYTDLDDTMRIEVDGGEWRPYDQPGRDLRFHFRFDARARVYGAFGDEPYRTFVVECDGKQHFKPVKFGGCPSDPDKQRHTDVRKMKWAFERDIPVIRVPAKIFYPKSPCYDPLWRERFSELCASAISWEPGRVVNGLKFPLFLYPGTYELYSGHVSSLEDAP